MGSNFIKQKIQYSKLNAKQQESYNFQKISAVLADYGYTTIKLDDDWEGADFIAMKNSNQQSSFIKVQLKGRLTIAKKYLGKELYIGFPIKDNWFLVPHDEIVGFIRDHSPKTLSTSSWVQGGVYSWNNLSKSIREELGQYKL